MRLMLAPLIVTFVQVSILYIAKSYLMAEIAVGRGVQGLARSGSAARSGRKTTGKKVMQSDGVYLHLFCKKADV